MRSTFAFQHTRTKVAGAAEAAPTATTDAIVWQSRAEGDVNLGELDGLLLECTGGNLAYELGIWDRAEAIPAFRVVETGTLTDATPRVIQWLFGGEYFYVRSTGVTGADITINATPVNYDPSADVEVAVDAMSTSLGTKLDTLHTDLGTTIHNDLNTTIHTDLATTLHTDLATTLKGSVDDLLAALESADSAAAITPHDSNTFTATRAVLVGGAGTLVAQFAGDGGNTTMAVLPGVYDISVILVHTSSTATGLVALY